MLMMMTGWEADLAPMTHCCKPLLTGWIAGPWQWTRGRRRTTEDNDNRRARTKTGQQQGQWQGPWQNGQIWGQQDDNNKERGWWWCPGQPKHPTGSNDDDGPSTCAAVSDCSQSGKWVLMDDQKNWGWANGGVTMRTVTTMWCNMMVPQAHTLRPKALCSESWGVFRDFTR